MDQSLENKPNLKNKIINFYNINKKKIYFLIAVSIILFISVLIYKNNLEKKNKLIAENYIKAGLYLASDDKEKSTKIYEKIILSENTFYSILSLNTILEKELITDQKKILNFFDLLIKDVKSQNQIDLLKFKKALYLLKVKKNKEADDILKSLNNENSKYSVLAQEVMGK